MSIGDIFATIKTEKQYSGDTKNLMKICRIEDTPLGPMIAMGDDEHIYMLVFEDCKSIDKSISQIKKERGRDVVIGESKMLKLLRRELSEYFAGTLKEFSTPLHPIGTEFQKESWEALGNLQYGETQSYSQLAAAMGRNSQHSRAVGGAAKANPMVLLVPCHRLTAASHNGGFSAGADRKIWLLKHEENYRSS